MQNIIGKIDSLQAESNFEELEIEVQVEKIIVHKADSFWSMVNCLPADKSPEFIAVGIMPGINEGDALLLSGHWDEHPRYGRRFKVLGCKPILPSTSEAIQKYLSSDVFEGVGKALAKRIVDKFGKDTLSVLQDSPDRLSEVSGLGKNRVEQIAQDFKEQQGDRDLLLFAHSCGLAISLLPYIRKRYGQNAIAKIKQDPYRLAIEIRGIGFLKADRIAQSLGVEEDSPSRLLAAVLHSMNQHAANGHCYARMGDLLEYLPALLPELDSAGSGLSYDEIRPIVLQLVEKQKLCIDEDVHGVRIYLAEFLKAEERSAMLLAEMLSAELVLDEEYEHPNAEHDLEWVQENLKIELASQQRDAIKMAIEQKMMVLTGGPGTGKTTIVRAILDIFDRYGYSTELAAPTGRAAKRLAESSGREAQTLHRLLEYNPHFSKYARDEEQPLECDFIIVDEFSMVDIQLFYNLLLAIPPGCRMLLVGDVDQLPSVGAGSVLADLINSGKLPVTRLTEVFRQAQESLIVANAHKINKGEFPDCGQRIEQGADFFFIERDEPEGILDTLLMMVQERIPQRFNINPIDDIQVLSPMRKALLGVEQLNSRLQESLNADSPPQKIGARELRLGDRVMQIRNNYDMEVYNGDTGRITELDESTQRLCVKFDDREVSYKRESINEITLAYACSIHKSQGSEYPIVVLPLHWQHRLLLQRNLLYTAITRARQLVVIVGSKGALEYAIGQHQANERMTALSDRIQKAVSSDSNDPQIAKE